MCLILTIRLADSDAARASEVCRAADLPTCLDNRRLFSIGRRPSGIVHIPGPDGSCGCSFLADSADWNVPTWDMIPSTLSRLAGILRAMRRQTSRGFSFDALWAGESHAEECRVTIEELAHLAEEGKLGTKTRYLVD